MSRTPVVRRRQGPLGDGRWLSLVTPSPKIVEDEATSERTTGTRFSPLTSSFPNPADAAGLRNPQKV